MLYIKKCRVITPEMLDWIASMDDDDTARLREVVRTLRHADRMLLLHYAESRSLRRTAAAFHVSKFYVAKQLARIRGLIKSHL